MTSDKLSLIADLLARAEGGSTQAERDLALERAQREAARHGIDLAEAAYAQAQRGVPLAPQERGVEIGRAGTRGLATYALLFVAVAEANDLKCLISHDNARIFAHGMPTDLDMAETIYASLVVQMEVAAHAWLATGEYVDEVRGTSVWSDTRGRWVPARPNRGVAQRNFQRGFVTRIGELLLAAREEARRESLARESSPRQRGGREVGAVTSTALALRAKSEAVETFHREQMVARRVRATWRGNRTPVRQHAAARAAGVAAADRADRAPRGTRGIGR